MLATNLNIPWRTGANGRSKHLSAKVFALSRVAAVFLAVTASLLSVPSNEAAASATTSIDAFHQIGGWFGESVTPSGITLRAGKPIHLKAEGLAITSVKILSSGDIELLLDTASLLSISLESSSDLNSWIPVVGAQVQPGRVTFSNPLRTLSEKSHQFFRLRINP